MVGHVVVLTYETEARNVAVETCDLDLVPERIAIQSTARGNDNGVNTFFDSRPGWQDIASLILKFEKMTANCQRPEVA